MKLAIGVLLILLLGLQYRLWVGDGSLSEVVQLKAELQTQQQRVNKLTHRNRVLEARVVELQHGSAAIEELARKDLGMIKKGETFFQIIEQKNTSQQPAK